MQPIDCNIIMLDNLDSFTYNLVDEFQCLGISPIVYRNTLSADFILNKIEQTQQQTKKPVLIVLSPGPGTPSQAGCLMELIAKTVSKYPLLGICLGHQALIQHYGGIIERAPSIVHGKSSIIEHNEQGAFQNIQQGLPVARYHSLYASKVPDNVTVTAHYQQLPMAIEQSNDAVIGFQFHPESILTTYGSPLLAQSIQHLLALHQQKNTAKGVQHG
jgi:anthranilate synthase component 2